jgi:hypothetical protein
MVDLLLKARDLAKEAMDTALACAQAFEDLYLATNRLLEERQGALSVVRGIPQRQEQLLAFEAEAPPRLTHSELLDATVDGEPVRDKTWNGALRAAVSAAARVARSPAERRKLFTKVRAVKWEPGNREGEKGYKYLPDVDISLQGRDADKVWEGMLGIAKELGFPIAVEFRWPHKEGVPYPGQTGRLAFDVRPGIDIDLDEL